VLEAGHGWLPFWVRRLDEHQKSVAAALPELGRVGRFQMFQAILHYALAPLFFAPLPLAAVNAATGGGAGTPRGALLLLLAAGYGMLLLPKLAGYAEALLRAGRAERGGLLRSMGEEVLLSLLLDPVGALDRSVTVTRLALGHRGGWAPQPRTGRGIPWSASLRRFGGHTVVGGALLAAFATAGWFAALVALPFVLGLLLAVPLCVVTVRPNGAP